MPPPAPFATSAAVPWHPARTVARRPALRLAGLSLLIALAAGGAGRNAWAAPGDQPVRPLPPAASPPQTSLATRSASLPARGLFDGNGLSAAARERLSEFIVDAVGQQLEIALIVPTGPWDVDGTGRGERDLTPARLQALKRFLSDRGVDPQRIVVEGRTDEKIKEPRLDLQLVTRPATD